MMTDDLDAAAYRIVDEWYSDTAVAAGAKERRILVAAIVAALRAQRRAVWEEAARHCQCDACGFEYKDPLMKRMAEYFQYRADHEKFGPAWERNKPQAQEGR